MNERLLLRRLRSHRRAGFWLAFFGKPTGPAGWVGARVMPLLTTRLSEPIATALGLNADDDVLDVGCGSGGFLQYTAGRVHSVAGLDASEVQLGLARRRLRDRIAAGTAELVFGDAEALPWEDGRFSAVASLNCLKFVPDPDHALAEMWRVLRAGGRLAIVVDPPVPDVKSAKIDVFGQWQWSAADLQRMVETAGFIDVSVEQLPRNQLTMQLVRGAKP